LFEVAAEDTAAAAAGDRAKLPILAFDLVEAAEVVVVFLFVILFGELLRCNREIQMNWLPENTGKLLQGY
jgi:hypothetical protein